MRLLKHSSFLAVSLSHFIVDVFNGQIGILLSVLSVPLALANSTIGLIATIYAISGAVSQPVFGWLSDRIGQRKHIYDKNTSGLARLILLLGLIPQISSTVLRSQAPSGPQILSAAASW